jgi:hypothetical protein
VTFAAFRLNPRPKADRWFATVGAQTKDAELQLTQYGFNSRPPPTKARAIKRKPTLRRRWRGRAQKPLSPLKLLFGAVATADRERRATLDAGATQAAIAVARRQNRHAAARLCRGLSVADGPDVRVTERPNSPRKPLRTLPLTGRQYVWLLTPTDPLTASRCRTLA